MSRKKGRYHYSPWWLDPRRCWRVYHSRETSYLVHFPQWGTPFVVAYVPREWGWVQPDDFGEILNTPEHWEMKKPVGDVGQKSGYAAPFDGIVDRWPLVAEHLTATAYDGDPPGSRQTSTLLVFCQDGTWRAVLRDRQEGRCLWVSSATGVELLDVLEHVLGDPAAVWRDDRVGGAETARRQNPGKRG